MHTSLWLRIGIIQKQKCPDKSLKMVWQKNVLTIKQSCELTGKAENMNGKQNETPEKSVKQKLVLELFIILLSSVAVYILAAYYDILEKIVEFSRQHENAELDEIVTVSIFLVVALALFSIRRWRELQKASVEIKQLKGIIPICASCKNIRDDKGFWQQVEDFVHANTEAEFSHGICPDCIRKLYPDLCEDEDKLKDED